MMIGHYHVNAQRLCISDFIGVSNATIDRNKQRGIFFFERIYRFFVQTKTFEMAMWNVNFKISNTNLF